MGLFDFLFGRRQGDGSSPERAVLVQSIAEEYLWLQKNCPGYQPRGQALHRIGGKPYDLLILHSPDGKERKVYFDISAFFGKPASTSEGDEES
jgi:hypothetical protein